MLVKKDIASIAVTNVSTNTLKELKSNGPAQGDIQNQQAFICHKRKSFRPFSNEETLQE